MTDAQAKRFTHDGPLLRMSAALVDDFHLVDWSFNSVADIVISFTPAPADATREVRMTMLKSRFSIGALLSTINR